MAFKSKYTGPQVEDLLDKVANGEISGGATGVETDPIFKASPAYEITSEDIISWNEKVDINDVDEAIAKAITETLNTPV